MKEFQKHFFFPKIRKALKVLVFQHQCIKQVFRIKWWSHAFLPGICKAYIPFLVFTVKLGFCNITNFCISQFNSRTSHSFIHSIVCLTTGSWPLPKQVLHTVRTNASSFNFRYFLISLRSSNSYLCLFPCRPISFISPPIFLLINH